MWQICSPLNFDHKGIVSYASAFRYRTSIETLPHFGIETIHFLVASRYYLVIDSGNKRRPSLSERAPWKSLHLRSRQRIKFQPVCRKRKSSFLNPTSLLGVQCSCRMLKMSTANVFLLFQMRIVELIQLVRQSNSILFFSYFYFLTHFCWQWHTSSSSNEETLESIWKSQVTCNTLISDMKLYQW